MAPVLAISPLCIAQMPASIGSAGHVVLSDLSPPTYPPLARQARIGGDVTIELAIQADGSIESVKAINGHPMLVQSALDSAKQSSFKCLDCTVGLVVSATLTYSFQISPRELDPCCCSSDVPHASPAPVLHVSESGDHIVLKAPPACICPDICTGRSAFQHAHFRSAKCLFLWKCGFHDYSVY
jgi:TonB family protein